MSVELYAGEAAEVVAPADAGPMDVSAREDRRPNVSGDLPTVLRAGPMFRRAVVGYDRFQVDTYVHWAEDEFATADREREHLIARCMRVQAELEESRQLLSHSPSGGEFLQVSRRIASLLATAADEAESLRADAQADRTAASTESAQTIARAELLLSDATAEAERLVTEAATEAAGRTSEARRTVAEAERQVAQLHSVARAEAEARVARAQLVEQRATEQAEQIRRQAGEAASAALLQARDEVVRMLDTAREGRRRADTEAAAIRARQEQETLA